MKKKDIMQFMDNLASDNSSKSAPTVSTHDDATLEALWNLLPEKPSESTEADKEQCERFALLIDGFNAGLQNAVGEQNAPFPFPGSPKLQRTWMPLILAACFVLTCTITGLGVWQYMETQNYRNEVVELKEWLAQSTVNSSPSTERIEDIYLTKAANDAFSPVGEFQLESAQIRELAETLRTDPSINVRFSVLQSLRGSIASPEVRAALLASIPYQSSRLVIMDISQLYLSACSSAELGYLMQTLDDSNLDPQWVRKFKELEVGQI